MNIKRFSGANILYNKLIEKKVTDVFLYSGGAIMPLVDCFYKGIINYYVNSHEQNCGHAATGYAKSTNKTGVCIVTSGPGLTNMITPMLDATNDSTPLIVFSGQVPLKSMGTNAFQECPAVDITKPITKWSYCIKDTNEIPYVIDEAFNIANNGKKGSVHIDLPKCILSNEYIYNNNNYKYNNYVVKNKSIDKEYIKKIANVINQSTKPVLYIGQGAKSSYLNIREIVKKGNIPITTTIHGMGIVDEEDNLSLEMLGMHGSVAANYSIQESDCIISIGTRFDDRTTGNIDKYAPNAIKAGKENRGGIIHCNINPKEIDNIIEPHYKVQCDAETFTNELLKHIQYKCRKIWLNEIYQWKIMNPFTYKRNINKIKTQDVIFELNNQLSNKNLYENTIISSGVGNHQMMAAQFIKWKYPNTFITSGSLGVMGVGLPYAIGCQIGNPNSLVIDIDGDGSFNHTLSDLKTIVEYNLPIKIIVLNDHNQSMVKIWEELFYDKRYTATSNNKNPKYHKLAKSYKIKSLYCKSKKKLEKTIHKLLTYKGPILANIITESDKCLPLVAPGKGLDEMILEDDFIDLKNVLPPS